MQQLRPHRRLLAAIVCLITIGVLAQVAVINILKPIMDSGVFENDFDDVSYLGTVLILLTVIYLFTMVATAALASTIASSVASDLRRGIISHALRSEDMGKTGNTSTKTMTTLTADVSTFQNFLYETLRTYLPLPLLMTVLFYLTFRISVIVGIMLLSVFLAIAVLTWAFGRRIYHLFPQQIAATDRVNNGLREKVLGWRTIRAYGAEEYEEEKFAVASRELGAVNRKVAVNSYFIPHLTTALIWIAIITIYMVASLDAYDRTVSSTELLLFMQYTTYIVATLVLIPYLSIDAPRALDAYDRIQNIIVALDGPEWDEAEGNGCKSQDGITVNGLTIVDSRGRRTVSDLTFSVAAGERLTILGPNGCGGSDIFAAMLGFAEPASGSVSVCGLDPSADGSRAVRECVAYANNSMAVITGTLRFNLDPRGKVSDERILDVCRRAGLMPLVESLPEGLDTVIQSSDVSLSGGQRQLLSIIRCLLRDVPVYVFDNCFFSLDADTRGKVLVTISEFCRGRTVIFNMHDVSTVPASDRVLLLQRGVMEGTGTHAELSASSSLYRDICREGSGGGAQWA